MAFVLLFSVFVVAACGLIYELVAGTLASYLLGDSVTQFSTVIGVYLSAMGVGSYISKYITKNLLANFIRIEIIIGLLGGCAAAFLFFVFGAAYSFRIVLYLVVFLIGMLVGLEIPLLMRILKERLEFADLVSKVLSFDYIGALVASVLFPLLFMPHLGLVKTCFFFGILNILVGIWALIYFAPELKRHRLLKYQAIFSLLILVFGFTYSDYILESAEASAYPAPIIYARTTPYQRIVITKQQDDVRLYLNSHLQFSSRDEYRYHEALVHVTLADRVPPQKVLILGGGDGMAARELLKYQSIEKITLVDLDPEMTSLFRKSAIFSKLNDNALNSEKVKIYNEDAFLWARQSNDKFDYVIMDLPDPTGYSLGKLYSNTFFKEIHKLLRANGRLVIQSTSPLLARRSYWCVNQTLKESGFTTLPYHAYVPSFGEWGFIIASPGQITKPLEVQLPLRFITSEVLPSLFYFPDDMSEVPVEVNRLNNQVLAKYYDEEWSRYTE